MKALLGGLSRIAFSVRLTSSCCAKRSCFVPGDECSTEAMLVSRCYHHVALIYQVRTNTTPEGEAISYVALFDKFQPATLGQKETPPRLFTKCDPRKESLFEA